MKESSRNLLRICKTANLNWRAAKRGCAVSKLAFKIPPPSPSRAIVFEGNGMHPACCDLRSIRQPAYLGRRMSVGRGTVTKLAS
jgi:hypothetical protein